GDYGRLEQHLLRNFRRYARRQAVPEDTVWMAGRRQAPRPADAPARLVGLARRRLAPRHGRRPERESRPRHLHVRLRPRPRASARAASVPARQRGVEPLHRRDARRRGRLARAAGRAAEDDVVLFFEPPALDDRIVNQYALFSLRSSPSARLDAWLEQ